MKIDKLPSFFSAKAMYRYIGSNMKHCQEKRFQNIRIKDVDYKLKEELLVKQIMFDGTEIMYSMISSNLFFKKNENFEFREENCFCDFCLFYDEDYMVFEGSISYLNAFKPNFEYKEYFNTTIILPFNQKLLDIWVKHDKQIQD